MNLPERDIETLELEFAKISGIWEYEDGNAYTCFHLAKKELILVKNIAKRYDFELKYDSSSYECDEWWGEDEFSLEDFKNNHVTVDNYRKADAAAFDLKEKLIAHLKTL